MCLRGPLREVRCRLGLNEATPDALLVGGAVDGSLELLPKSKETAVRAILGLEYGNCGKVPGDS